MSRNSKSLHPAAPGKRPGEWSRFTPAGRSSLDCKAAGDECEFRRVTDGPGNSSGGAWMCLERRHGSKTAAQSEPELEDCWSRRALAVAVIVQGGWVLPEYGS